jgi:hypothetical protein
VCGNARVQHRKSENKKRFRAEGKEAARRDLKKQRSSAE